MLRKFVKLAALLMLVVIASGCPIRGGGGAARGGPGVVARGSGIGRGVGARSIAGTPRGTTASALIRYGRGGTRSLTIDSEGYIYQGSNYYGRIAQNGWFMRGNPERAVGRISRDGTIYAINSSRAIGSISASINGISVNLRSGPSTSYSILQTLGRGQRVYVQRFDQGRSWFEVRLPDGTVGWVHASLVLFSATIEENER